MKVGDKWLSLNALRAFEATGRHLNMSRAAEELSITQSAVSHQIRQLERTLDIELFFRASRTLRLTPAGAKLLATVQRSFDDIASTILNVNDDLLHGDLYVASVPGFTYLWLAKRLPEFLAKFPGLTLRRSALPMDGHELSVNVDIAIAHGVYQFPGRRVELLSEIGFYPVCVPDLVPKGGKLDPAELKNHTLIHEDDGDAWANWFAAFGVELGPANRDIYVGSEPVALSLAEAGVGFALNQLKFGLELNKDRNLVRPFGETIVSHERYYLITHPKDQMSAAALEFESWIRAEVGASLPFPMVQTETRT